MFSCRRSRHRRGSGQLAIVRCTVDTVVLATTSLVATDVNHYSRALRYDYDFFLGPVNAMRHGHPLLVDTFSQYGVGMFYALAGVFNAYR